MRKQKEWANHLFQSICVPEQCAGIFIVSNEWTKQCNNMTGEIAVVKVQSKNKSKKWLKRKGMPT